MTGETKAEVSGWTVDTLRALMDERDKRYMERFIAQEKAIEVAQATAKDYRSAANEWREAMKDRESQFVRKGENNWLIGAVVALVAIASLAVTLSGHWK